MQTYIHRLFLFLPLQFSTLSSLSSASHVKRTLRRWLGKLDLVYLEARQHGRICKPCLTLFSSDNTDSRFSVLRLLQDVRCCSYPYRCQIVIFSILYSNTTTSFASPLYTKSWVSIKHHHLSSLHCWRVESLIFRPFEVPTFLYFAICMLWYSLAPLD